MNKAQRADLVSAKEKKSFRVTYALKVKQRTQIMKLGKRPSPKHRTFKDDAEELLAAGFKNMAHKEAAKIRADLCMVLTDGLRVLHVCYLQENQVELVTPRHQEQALKDQLAAVGYIIKSSHSPLSMQVRSEIDGNKRERSNAYCAARALERTLKVNVGRSVSAFYKKLIYELQGK